jgi:hypothetical protein
MWVRGGPAMLKRLPASPPGPLDNHAAHFDDLFDSLAQHQAFLRYLWRDCCCRPRANKTLPALASTEPVVGRCAAQRGTRPAMVLPESTWNPEEVSRRRVKFLLEDDEVRYQTPWEPFSHRDHRADSGWRGRRPPTSPTLTPSKKVTCLPGRAASCSAACV